MDKAWAGVDAGKEFHWVTFDHLFLAGCGDERTLLLSLTNGFHEKASLVKVNVVVTEASTIQDKTPFRYASIRCE